MGLGKTVQVLKTLWWLCERRGVEGPFLVVAPLATLWHWKREAEQWTGLRCEVLHDNAEARRLLLNWALRHTDQNGRPTGRRRFHLVVTSYEHVSMELSVLSSVRWHYLCAPPAEHTHHMRRRHAAPRRATSRAALRAGLSTRRTG